MEEEEGTRVLGVGVGLFLIILVWSLAVATLLVVTRRGAGASVGIVTTATIVTMVLLLIPRQDKHTDKDEDVIEGGEVPVDRLFIWRTIMVILSCLFSIIGVILVGLDYGMHTIKPVQLKKTL